MSFWTALWSHAWLQFQRGNTAAFTRQRRTSALRVDQKFKPQ